MDKIASKRRNCLFFKSLCWDPLPVPFSVPRGTGSANFLWDPEPVPLGQKWGNVPEPVPSGSGPVPPLDYTGMRRKN